MSNPILEVRNLCVEFPTNTGIQAVKMSPSPLGRNGLELSVWVW